MDLTLPESFERIDKVYETMRFCVGEKFRQFSDQDSYLTDAIYVHLLQEHQVLDIDGTDDFLKRKDAFCNSRINAMQFAQSPIQELISAIMIISSSEHNSEIDAIKKNIHSCIETYIKFDARTGLVKDLTHTLILLYSIAKLKIWDEEAVAGKIIKAVGSQRIVRGLDTVFAAKLAILFPQNEALSEFADRLKQIQRNNDSEEYLYYHYAYLWYSIHIGNKKSQDLLLKANSFISGISLDEFVVSSYFEDYKLPNKWLGSIYPCFLLSYAILAKQIYFNIMSEEKRQAELRDFEELLEENGHVATLQKKGDSFTGSSFKILKVKDKFRVPLLIDIQVSDIIRVNNTPYRITSMKDYLSNSVIVGKEVICEAIQDALPTTQITFTNSPLYNSPFQVGGTGNSQNVRIIEPGTKEVALKLIELLQTASPQNIPKEITLELEEAKKESEKPSPAWSKVANSVKNAIAWVFNNPDKASLIAGKLQAFYTQHGQQLMQYLN